MVTENVKIPNAVLVSGLTKTEVDNDIFDFLKQYGSISRLINIPTTDCEPQVIVEFEYGTAVKALETGLLPLQRPCTANPYVIHHVQSLASVYTVDAGTTATNTYLSGLRDLAKLSSKQFEDILHEELARINESVDSQTSHETGENPVEPVPSSPQSVQPSMQSVLLLR